MAAALWEQLYEGLGWFADEDESGDLRKFCEAWTNTLLQPVYDLAGEGDDGEPPWAVLLDPDNCPAASLPYLAQYVGVVVTPEMDEAQIRREIKEPTGWSRGQINAVKIAAGRGLTGTRLVIVKPRTPEVGHHYVRTLLAETPDPERTKATVRAAVPAWEKLDYEAFVGMTYADTTAKYSTYALRSAAYGPYSDATEDEP